MTKSSPLVIIPAAGFGLRSGAKGSKELLRLPTGETLIGQALRLVQDLGWDAHVIVREEKEDLKSYLKPMRGPKLGLQEIRASQEWPETLLLSRDFWRDWNFLLLPDTEFEPRLAPNFLYEKLRQGSYNWGGRSIFSKRCEELGLLTKAWTEERGVR